VKAELARIGFVQFKRMRALPTYKQQIADFRWEGIRSDWETEGPVASISNALQMRGFLVRLQGEDILLSKGSSSDDIANLALLGLSSIELIGDHSNFASVKLLPPTSLDPLVLCRKILSVVNHNGWASLPSEPFHIETFTSDGYGPQVPVRYLEPGIAFLVKILPLFGMHTVSSCDGHLLRSPKIWLPSLEQLNWARRVMDLVRGNIARVGLEVSFDAADTESVIFQYSITFDHGGDSYLHLIDKIFRFSRAIFENEKLIARIQSEYLTAWQIKPLSSSSVPNQ